MNVRQSPDTNTDQPPVSTIILSGMNDIKLVADAWSDADAVPVLFLHGGGQTRHAWRRTAATLACEGWRAVSLDMRGHGESEWAPDGMVGASAAVSFSSNSSSSVGRGRGSGVGHRGGGWWAFSVSARCALMRP